MIIFWMILFCGEVTDTPPAPPCQGGEWAPKERVLASKKQMLAYPAQNT